MGSPGSDLHCFNPNWLFEVARQQNDYFVALIGLLNCGRRGGKRQQRRWAVPLPFESPKLIATTYLSNADEFGARLDKAIENHAHPRSSNIDLRTAMNDLTK